MSERKPHPNMEERYGQIVEEIGNDSRTPIHKGSQKPHNKTPEIDVDPKRVEEYAKQFRKDMEYDKSRRAVTVGQGADEFRNVLDKYTSERQKKRFDQDDHLSTAHVIGRAASRAMSGMNMEKTIPEYLTDLSLDIFSLEKHNTPKKSHYRLEMMTGAEFAEEETPT